MKETKKTQDDAQAADEPKYSEYVVSMRSRTTAGVDSETIRVWQGQDVSEQAERIANGYGADVEGIALPDGSPYDPEKDETQRKAMQEETVAALMKSAEEWQATADRGKGALIGERMIILDNHERAYTQYEEGGETKFKFEMPRRDLSGVSHMTPEAAELVKTSLEEKWPEHGPFEVRDFQEYAKAKVAEAVSALNSIRERVYDFSNGFRREAENMYGWLRHEQFTPKWDTGSREGEYRMGITIPVHEVPQLRIFQRTNPARWGDHPDVMKKLEEARQAGLEQEKINRERAAKLTPEQREFVETIHYQTNLHYPQALELNEKLHELAAQHFKLAHINVMESGLTKQQEHASDAIEQRITALLDGVPHVKGPKFLYDPRGTTVSVKFESGASDSFAGGYKVPLNPERVKALDNESFWEAYASAENGNYFVLTIDNTMNAAFVDVGRDEEIARIIDEAADEIALIVDMADVDFSLRDVNGNRVGRVEVIEQAPAGDPDNGTVRLVVSMSNAAFEDDASGEVARILRESAERVRYRDREFALLDGNGNVVGKYEYHEEPSWDKEGVIDMNEALSSGRVYWADDSYIGIADGEYRFVVTTPDFEPGYGQGEGDVWLVNAKGDKAPGYDDPQSVRETDFRDLNSDEKLDLRAVVEGHMSFEDYERKFDSDEFDLN